MKPKCELYLSSFSCSFFSAQSSLVSIALLYSNNTHDFFSLSKARSAGDESVHVFLFEVNAKGQVVFFDVFS